MGKAGWEEKPPSGPAPPLQKDFREHRGKEFRVQTHLKSPCCWERLKAGGEGETEDEMAGWRH